MFAGKRFSTVLLLFAAWAHIVVVPSSAMNPPRAVAPAIAVDPPFILPGVSDYNSVRFPDGLGVGPQAFYEDWSNEIHQLRDLHESEGSSDSSIALHTQLQQKIADLERSFLRVLPDQNQRALDRRWQAFRRFKLTFQRFGDAHDPDYKRKQKALTDSLRKKLASNAKIHPQLLFRPAEDLVSRVRGLNPRLYPQMEP